MTASEFWRTHGGVSVGGEGLEHFGDPHAEAARAFAGRGAQLVPLLTTTPLRVTGADRVAFLHGQLSNVVAGLAAGACAQALQLDARGRVVGDADLCVRRDDLFVAVHDARGAAVQASLEQHVVFDDVQVSDLGEALTAVTVQGAAATEVVARAFGVVPGAGGFVQVPFGAAAGDGATDASAEPPSVLLLGRRRSAAGGVDVHVLVRQLAELARALLEAGADLAGERALTIMRVLAGVPSVAREAPDGALPQELGLTSAVSFAKGCYLGQEIMARIEARGAVKKGLARLRLERAANPDDEGGAAALEGRELRLGGREIGRVGSVVALPDGALAGLAVLRTGLPVGADLEVVGVPGAYARVWPPSAAGGMPGRTDAAGAVGGVHGGTERDPDL